MGTYLVASDVRARSEEVNQQTSVRIVRSISELEDVRGVWNSWQRHPNSDIDFYLYVLRSNAEILRPHIMLACRGGSPEAMLIGRLENKRIEVSIGYKRLFSLRVPALTFVYGGLLGDPSPEVSRAFVREIMDSLRTGEADVAYFNHLRTDSSLHCSILGLPGVLTRDYFPTRQTHRAVSLAGSVDDFSSAALAKGSQEPKMASEEAH